MSQLAALDSSRDRAFELRAYRSEDRAAVRNVCWETAYLGGRIDFQYRDKESWADLFTSYYTDHEPESAQVAVARDGRVVGYLLGCVDTRRAPSEWHIAMRHHLTRLLWARPGTAGFWWRLFWDKLWRRKRSGVAVDLSFFPAHTHIDLLPEARGHGVAARLFDRWHDQLERQGIAGVHCQVLAENTRILGLLTGLGYELRGEPFVLPGLRTPRGGRAYGRLIVKQLRARV